jgi:transposase
MSTAQTGTDVGTWRRQRAWELHQAGWWQKDIAVALGVTRGAVSQWIKRGREGGVAALRTRTRPGGSAKLTTEQRAQIPALLARGALSFGFRGDVWTANRIAEVIGRTFGVRYHPDHASRLLRQAGWSVQRPIQRARQRDEAAIKRWQEDRWPAFEKSGRRRLHCRLGRRIGLLPTAARGADLGAQRRDARAAGQAHPRYLSAISGITLDGRLFMQVREGTFDSQRVVGFLRVLLRKIRGKVLVIWDGSPIHKGQPIKEYLARGAAKRLHLERLPGYAPDLNPDEGIWNYLKRVELKNRCCADLAELRRELRRAKERLRHKRHIIRSCSIHCGYSEKTARSRSVSA